MWNVGCGKVYLRHQIHMGRSHHRFVLLPLLNGIGNTQPITLITQTIDILSI